MPVMSPTDRSPLLAFVCLAAALVSAAVSATPAAAQQSPFNGRWRYDGGNAQRRAMNQAIDAALDDFNPVMREIVASQLRETNRTYPSFMLHIGAESITARVNGQTVTTPADGSPRRATTPEGRTAQISQRVVNGHLMQTMVNPQGTRYHTLSIGADGRLTVEVRISSPHMASDIVYRLTYRREG